MATLEDKIMGEKLEYYCSSSEDEGEEEGIARSGSNAPAAATSASSGWSGSSQNTGPKGVIEDYEKFKAIERIRHEQINRLQVELAKSSTLTCQTAAEDEERRKNEELERELAELMDENILLEFQKQRVAEIAKKCKVSFGQLIDLKTKNDFLEIVEKELENLVIVHISEKDNNTCKLLNQCFVSLAEKFRAVKFCKMLVTTAGMSIDFKRKGVPAILIYQAGKLVGNHVRVTDELGDDFFPSDIENFLIEKGFPLEEF